jgi:hypothetical protein
VGEIVAGERPGDAAGGRRAKSGDQAQKGRFPAARGAEQADELALPDGEVDVGEGDGPIRIDLADPLDPMSVAAGIGARPAGLTPRLSSAVLAATAMAQARARTKLRILPGLSSP